MADAYFTLGVTLWQQGKPYEAIPKFRLATGLRPDYAEAHYILGTILKQTGQTFEAVTEFQAAVAANPDYAEARRSLGTALRESGDLDGAREQMQEAQRLTQLKAKQQAATFAVSVGKKRLDQGDLDQAVSQFQSAIGMDPDSAEAHYHLGLALTAKGDEAGAQKAFERAQQLDPKRVPPGSR